MIERAAIDFAAGRSRIVAPHLRQEVFEAMFQRFLDAFACVRGASIAKGNTCCEIC
jgi:hypothetical protein